MDRILPQILVYLFSYLFFLQENKKGEKESSFKESKPLSLKKKTPILGGNHDQHEGRAEQLQQRSETKENRQNSIKFQEHIKLDGSGTGNRGCN